MLLSLYISLGATLMKKTIKVTICQFTPKCGDKEYNLKKVENMLNGVVSDLIVLPEFFSTGISHDAFINHPENSTGGKTIEQMQILAKKLNSNIVCGSVIEKENDKYYNTCFVVNRDGQTVAKYRKIHLFDSFGGTEDQRMTRGVKPILANLDIGKIGLSICFDIRFPMHFQTLKEQGANLFVCPTAWGYSPQYKNSMDWLTVWKSMNISRANENITPFVSSNQIGYSDSGFYSIGNSIIADKNGTILANLEAEEAVKTMEFDID